MNVIDKQPVSQNFALTGVESASIIDVAFHHSFAFEASVVLSYCMVWNNEFCVKKKRESQISSSAFILRILFPGVEKEEG